MQHIETSKAFCSPSFWSVDKDELMPSHGGVSFLEAHLVLDLLYYAFSIIIFNIKI